MAREINIPGDDTAVAGDTTGDTTVAGDIVQDIPVVSDSSLPSPESIDATTLQFAVLTNQGWLCPNKDQP